MQLRKRNLVNGEDNASPSKRQKINKTINKEKGGKTSQQQKYKIKRSTKLKTEDTLNPKEKGIELDSKFDININIHENEESSVSLNELVKIKKEPAKPLKKDTTKSSTQEIAKPKEEADEPDSKSNDDFKVKEISKSLTVSTDLVKIKKELEKSLTTKKKLHIKKSNKLNSEDKFRSRNDDIEYESTSNVDLKVEKNSESSLASTTLTKVKKESAKSLKKNDVPITPPLEYESLGTGPASLPFTGKKYVGCHVSAAGGVWNSFANGEMSNANSIAMFLRNQRSWNAKPLDEETVQKWNEAIKDFPPHLILPHGSYLMNLGSPKKETLEKSRNLLVEELQRCEKLGIPHFNFHPGSTVGEISREECCKLIAESINFGHSKTSTVICVIENMSRQGFTVGGDFNEIRLIIEGVEDKTRVGVCIDTCHAHAAGYDLATEEGFQAMVGDFEKIIGWQFLRGLHVNDSKGRVGDHKDRHEVIGEGFIGKEGFRRIMNYPKFNDIPLILETPFVNEDHYGKEIKLLQSMVKEIP